MDFTPFIPGDKSLANASLLDQATDLNRASATLAGKMSPLTMDTIRTHMAVINSYYSNLIEGHKTLPREIREAQRGRYSDDPSKRDLQVESMSHIDVQNWMYDQAPDFATVCAPDYLLEIHRRFYEGVPPALREVHDQQASVLDTVTPGQWRKRDVTIGDHTAPAHGSLPSMMTRFCEEYGSRRYQGDHRLIAILSAHHRLLWVHPFLDGNGRVARLWTDAALRAIGLESAGVWSLSRGLARQSSDYKEKLARADFVRQGSLDGRGHLSDRELTAFCQFMMDTALDQVRYISDLLEISSMKERISGYVQARRDKRVPGVSGDLRPTAATVLYAAFLQGELKRSEALELTGLGSERNARRMISQLKEDGLLSETSNRSPLRWEIPEHAEPWYFPGLTA